jgi:filamentous hemagglutinin family protein
MSKSNACRKLSGISLTTLAISLMIMPQNASAQSFQGTPTVQFGSASITTSPATTNIVIDTPRAVINWDLGAPSGGGAIEFQPQNTTANFFSSPAVNYVVLNRILPTDLTRAVQFNGTVNAGGNNGVFFYSPGGIVLGNTAVFNVGRLLLTANDVAVDGNGGFFFANDLNLTAAIGSTAAVSIAADARINALAEGSFVLAVAPRVLDSGITVVNGTKALIAAEAVDLTYNAGLFDITVTQGTEYAGDALRHEGSTTGPASSGAGDYHRVYMVAIPKNNAISMFVSGVAGLGFDVAGAANVVGNAIVLSGGSYITEASSGTGSAPPFAQSPATTVAADIDVTQGNYTSSVNVLSNNAVRVSTIQPGNITFANALTVQAVRDASLSIANGSVTVINNLQMSSDAISPIANGSNQQAGTASISVGGTGNSLTVGGFTTVSANGNGADAPAAGGAVNGGTGLGGTTFVNVTAGATFNANGGFRVQANGNGGAGTLGGSGIGGNANVTSSNSALRSVGGYAVNADGTGGNGTQLGGNGAGGAASSHAEGPTGLIDISAADGFFVTATGLGGNGIDSISGAGGTGTGGTVVIRATNGGNLNVNAIQSRADASAIGGFGFVGGGGMATGGDAELTIFGGGAIRFTRPGSEVRVNSFAFGGDGNPGGAANAGTSAVSIDTSGTLQVESDNFVVNAAATGGSSTLFDGGRAVAGTAIVGLAGTATFTGAALIDAQGRGGAGADSAAGGAGVGGNAQLNSSGASVFSSTLTAIADGTGGDGLTGGAGTAGNTPGASIFINGGTTSVAGAASITAQGAGGASTGFGTGGSANGGNANLTVVTGGTGLFSSNLDVSGAAAGGAGRDGGDAAAGSVEAVARGGSLSITGASNLSALGTGGNAAAGLGGIGGNGTGGSVSFTASNTAANATLNAAAMNAIARGVGGAGGGASAALIALGLPGNGGNGGNGSGGNVAVGSTNSAGNIILGAVNANGAGSGGIGGAGGAFGPGGNGGNATGGEVRVGFGNANATATGTMRAASVLASTSSLAGSGGTGTAVGNGGEGFGGNTILGNTAGGAFSVAGAATAGANGAGGFGATIGMGYGGNAIILTGPNPNAVGASSFTAGSTNVQASGFRQALVGGSPVIEPTGRFGRAIIFANGGSIQLGPTSIFATGPTGQTTVPSTLGLVNSGLMARNARLLITNNFNGLFASNAALGADGGNIDFVGPVGSGFTFNTPANIVDTLTGAPPAGLGQVTSNMFLNISAGGNILTPNSTYVSQLTTNIVAGGNLFARGVTAGGNLFLQSGGNLNVGNVLGGGVLEALSGGSLAFGNIRADSDVDLTAAGAVATGTISSGDTVTIGSGSTITTGDIDAGINNPSADPAVAYAVGLRGLGNVTTGNINAANRIGIGSDTGAISTGAINTGEFFLALADTGVTVNGVITTGAGANGITYIADASMLALINPVTLDPSPIFNAAPTATDGPIAIAGPVTTGRFVAATNGSFTAAQAVNANTSALISSGGLATFNGIVNAPNITITSNGLDIGVNGGLGTGTTSALNLAAGIGAGPVRLGGDAGTGYVIDVNEMARLRAQNIRFRTSGTAAPLLTIGSFTMQGSSGASPNLIGGSGAFTIETNGSVRVIGTAAIDGAAPGNALSINADGRFDVVTDQGGAIRLSNAAGDPAGILNLSAGTIASATSGLIDQLTQNADFTGRDDALDAAALIPVPQGYVGAGTMNVRVSNGFFVQNSNTSQLRAGFNVGAGGLTVAPIAGTTTPIEMIVNGRAVQAGGIFLTNQNTKDAATFDPLSAFAPTAKLNGCLISAAFCANFGGDALAFIGTQQGNAVQHQQADREEGEFAYTLPIVLIDSLVSDPASEEQIRITEPVTGSGNSEIWSKPEGETP